MACVLNGISFIFPSIGIAQPKMTPSLLQTFVSSHTKMSFASLLQHGRLKLSVTPNAGELTARASHLPLSRCCFSSTTPIHLTEPTVKDSHSSSSSIYASLDSSTGRRTQRPIFVAATRQHVGKTTVSLALMSGLQKRFNKVGFLKPVGQQVRTLGLVPCIRCAFGSMI